jgi:hypothetical protein
MEAGPLLLVQARTRAAREAADLGHALGQWEAGATYPGGEQDWWARCQRCGCLAWVMAGADGHGTIQHVPGSLPPQRASVSGAA